MPDSPDRSALEALRADFRARVASARTDADLKTLHDEFLSRLVEAATAFAAIGYVTLTPLYLSAIENGAAEVSLIRRQLKLVAASARGRI